MTPKKANARRKRSASLGDIPVRIWADTVMLLSGILGDLPSGPFGGIVKLCVAGIILLATLAIVDMLTLKRTDIVIEILILMFLFFMTSVVVYVIRPPADLPLAEAQEKRLKQIAPRPIQHLKSEQAS